MNFTYVLVHGKRDRTVLVVETVHFGRILVEAGVVLGNEILGDNISSLHAYLLISVSGSFILWGVK